jgi:hypothetical protein
MNKKQLANLVAAIVIAANKHANTTMETTEDEARTLVGMALRKQANQLVCDASGCDAEEAKTLLSEAQAEIAATIQAKKDAKKETADAGE